MHECLQPTFCSLTYQKAKGGVDISNDCETSIKSFLVYRMSESSPLKWYFKNEILRFLSRQGRDKSNFIYSPRSLRGGVSNRGKNYVLYLVVFVWSLQAESKNLLPSFAVCPIFYCVYSKQLSH